jgi:protein-disulfide isomerase
VAAEVSAPAWSAGARAARKGNVMDEGQHDEQPAGHPDDGQRDDGHPDGGQHDDGQRTGSRRTVWVGVGTAVVLLAVLIIVGVTSGGGGPAAADKNSDRAAPSAVVPTPPPPAARRIPGDPLAMGSPTAPVVIVEWADFQCPFCAAFARDTEPALVDQYVKTGKARFEWRDFAFLGPESTSAAVAARAAGRQGKFWAYHDALYTQQHSENSGALTSDYLLGLARQVGLDPTRFQADVADPTLARQVATDQKEGEALGIDGTPAVVINGHLMSGAQQLPNYQKVIDAALSRATATR